MHYMLIWTKNCQSRLKQSEYICDAVEVLSNPSNPVLLRIPPDKLWEEFSDTPLHTGSNKNKSDLKKDEEMQRNKKRFLAVYEQPGVVWPSFQEEVDRRQKLVLAKTSTFTSRSLQLSTLCCQQLLRQNQGWI